ncbi:PREDICTED: interleukin-20 receptor subunit alpha isoform X3 [Chinchilla lanigera]|uniref:interleukin-20 receptor subunit alpha isoform X3 n=1 Tax=Chinchilla lanigera TaxID=34839 RepID=UPI00038EFF54|nr:PREDICTED: interleukin-20 receptor subunit alpha isoform X3 [Chinchilla lanigera]
MRAPESPAPGRPALRLLLSPLLLLAAATSGRAAPCISGGLPKPANVTFLSINMKNILHWDPPESLQGAEVTYTVQYFIYGQKRWLNKPECKNINRTYCDLSDETSDYEHQYYAKVKAIWKTNCSKWTETGRFYPFLETQIGPPEVALTTDEKSISIVLTAPDKWKRNPEDYTISMQQIYSNLKYNVSVYNIKSRRTVESFVPGLPRPAQPSRKQCISTLEDPTSALKVKIIFWYVLPTSVTVFLFSVIGYSIYRYVHVGKEKHPANLILIYGNEFDKRFFVPAEKIMINFITLNILDDSKMPQKDMNLLDKSSDGSKLSDPEPLWNPEPHLEEVEVEHLEYAPHLVGIFCDSATSLTQRESLSSTTAAGEAAVEYECDVRTDTQEGPEGHQFSVQEVASVPGKLLQQQAALTSLGPPTLLCSYSAQLSDLHNLVQERLVSEEGPEEEPRMTLVDWDPQTGRLRIPSLSSFDQDPKGNEYQESDGLAEEGLLSRLYEAPGPDKAAEDENYLLRFMAEWGLHVQMEN